MHKLTNKVALLTGAAGGLGAATAKLFAEQGAKLVLADIDEQAVRSLAQDIPASIGVKLDVSDEAAWQHVVELAVSTFGGIDILINNAGIERAVPMMDTSVELFNLMTNTNQLGCFLGMKTAGALMSPDGAIVNLSSLAGLQGFAGRTAYAASKFAVRGMTKVAALELAERGIRVNSVHPGPINTAMLAASTNAQRSPEELARATAALNAIPLKRVAEPDEIAKMLLFLACEDSAYSTGAEFVCDGGMAAGPALQTH